MADMNEASYTPRYRAEIARNRSMKYANMAQAKLAEGKHDAARYASNISARFAAEADQLEALSSR